MAASEDLPRFVSEALSRGVPRAEIERVLLQAGWSAQQARQALAGFAEVAFPIPVPRPRRYTSARDAFLYGVLFLAMYVSAFNLGELLFALIEWAIPDSALQTGVAGAAAPVVRSLREATRGPISVLVVAVPTFLYCSSVIASDIRLDPGQRLSKIRAQLTYLTLFVGAAVIIGVLASVVHALLGGELTTRFALKALTVAAIAAAVFGYYLRDMRPDEDAANA